MDQLALQDRLTALADRHHVVGAGLAVAVGDDTAVAASGVLNLRTGAPATADSVFQIGSITKIWTTTLAMQLVDEGLLDLDAPLVTYLPDFRVLDEETTASVTARHLLNHTSGIAGDFFPYTGRGDDNLSRFVTEMADLAASHPLGATMSYSNAGFSLLGRLVEVLRGATWDEVLREHLLDPLGLDAAGTLPEEALLWGAAVGHIGGEVTPQWGLPRCIGPAGLIHARAADLLAFARLHLADGVTATGRRLLSADSAAAMRRAEVAIPEPWTSGSHVGLGWMLFDWGTPVYGHDGSTLGQHAFLRIVPGPVPVVVALLTTGGDAEQLYQDLFTELLADHANVTVPPPPRPPAEPLPATSADIAGSYDRPSMACVVEDRADGAVLIARPSGVVATSLGTDQLEGPLVPFGPDAFLTRFPGRPGWLPVVFYRLADGTRYVHVSGLATARKEP
ncbi:serine hydrolase domain-containing protein [Umezawaea endophytica]|uniref:Beta-lactamase family protein n=1 Tax=Umezawaea endophytica TaxID=1654476 RepID=A0A9X2VFN7_9PSEU|nr:serine hydrolase domain-containing protein [Umezawaea endophytica]MCS7475721.1 beta-lactamase family protein [Umezawaea endophytica]